MNIKPLPKFVTLFIAALLVFTSVNTVYASSRSQDGAITGPPPCQTEKKGHNGFCSNTEGQQDWVMVSLELEDSKSLFATETTYRSGWSAVDWDITGGTSPTLWIYGTHNSGSDLWETDIWVDGTLKKTTMTGYADDCIKHTSGKSAVCATDMQGSTIPLTKYRADSTHHFHTAGYVDSDFNTSKTFTFTG